MKKLLYLLSFVFVAAVIFSCAKEAESTKIQGEVQVENRDNSVWLCHKPDGNNPHAVYVDENAVDAHLGHGDVLLDADGDGYTATNQCGEGSMDDCDDNNAAINPGATEVPYDGIDNDCNPATLDDDLDEDGYINADDCDDNDATVNPGAEEVCGNEVDENCNEEMDEGCDFTVKVLLHCNPSSTVLYTAEGKGVHLLPTSGESYLILGADVSSVIMTHNNGNTATISEDSNLCAYYNGTWFNDQLSSIEIF